MRSSPFFALTRTLQTLIGAACTTLPRVRPERDRGREALALATGLVGAGAAIAAGVGAGGTVGAGAIMAALAGAEATVCAWADPSA